MPRRLPLPLVRSACRAAALALLIYALTASGSAGAEKSAVRDHPADVVLVDDPPRLQTPQPSNRSHDITEASARHSRTRLIVKFSLRDLAGNVGLEAVAAIRSNRGRNQLSLLKLPGRPAVLEVAKPKGPKRACRRLRHDFDASKNRIIVSVPRTCLGNPRWIRVGLGVFSVDGVANYADDARRDGGLKDSGELTLSGRLKRG